MSEIFPRCKITYLLVSMITFVRVLHRGHKGVIANHPSAQWVWNLCWLTEKIQKIFSIEIYQFSRTTISSPMANSSWHMGHSWISSDNCTVIASLIRKLRMKCLRIFLTRNDQMLTRRMFWIYASHTFDPIRKNISKRHFKKTRTTELH